MKYYENFKGNRWKKTIDVADFIQANYTEAKKFTLALAAPTQNTLKQVEKLNELLTEETKKGILDAECKTSSNILAYGPGYLLGDSKTTPECIVGLQTDKPLKRALFAEGGIKIAKKALSSYGYELDKETEEIFTKYRKTHNQGVFDVYPENIKVARHNHVITGLPDGYGRGRIIGDYRRVALYGVDRLILEKQKSKASFEFPYTPEIIQKIENLEMQIKALADLKQMAKLYGFDISLSAQSAKEAVQWTYFAYLAAIKQQNGAAMSLGRVSTFFDIYIEKDKQEGKLTESEAQELIDNFVLKLRMVRFARTPEYNSVFSGDPVWVTESIAGMNGKTKSFVTNTSFRMLHTLYNLGVYPEPNLTVLWSEKLPVDFKKFCAKVSIETSAIQYENDNSISEYHGSDYAIACCVSPMAVGKEMQFFGARANLAKTLLYALNQGRDEITGEQVISLPNTSLIQDGKYEFKEVYKVFKLAMKEVAKLYVNALNIIHYMHDKYAYESLQMALLDDEITRNFATGIAGLSVVADSLSAIKFGQVEPIYDPETNLVVDFKTTGEWPRYGNADNRADELAVSVVKDFWQEIAANQTYLNARPTMSILTITSNVVYGTHTGSTPDGRKKGEPFAPGANPMHGRDNTGALNSLLSVAKIPFEFARDGISNTFQLLPESLGSSNLPDYTEVRKANLVSILDGYFKNKGYHLNINVFNREKLIDAYKNPEKFPNLTIRVSGYAVNFSKLTDQQKLEVIARTIHATR